MRSLPLCRSADHYPLGSIDERPGIEFIRTRFVHADKTIDSETIRSVCRITQGHPFYNLHGGIGLPEMTA